MIMSPQSQPTMLVQLLRVIFIVISCVTFVHAEQVQPSSPNVFDATGNLLKSSEPGMVEASSPTRGVAASGQGRRIALVIGNDAYQKVSKLEKAGNDATAMARELTAAGFKVQLHLDLNYRGMVKAIETLSNSITGGDQVVVFFAGHGVQIKSGSYLLPVDIEANSESEVEKTAYGLNDLAEKLSEAKASFTLVIVDACRNNPLKSRGRSVGATRGLSAIEPPKGQMVVYSASRGQQALDRLNDADTHPNGVFTREFIARMKRPGVRIEDLVREVQESVEAIALTVSHEQRPAIYNEARGNFYFFGPTTVTVQSAIIDPETEAWRAAESANSINAYKAYLYAYPAGRFVVSAKIKLDSLQKPAAPPEKTVSPTTPKPASVTGTAAPEEPETAFWNEVKANGAKEYYEAYLRQYPKGKYLALARLEIKKIDDREKAEQVKVEAERKALLALEVALKKAAVDQQNAEQARQDKDAWNRTKAANTLAAYMDYLHAYPQGRYATLALAAQQKAEKDEGEKKRQEVAGQRDEEARQRLGQERDRIASEKVDIESSEGKVFRDCPDCPEMVVIMAGSFKMGDNSGSSDEKPLHSVRISRSFALARTEVTQGQWRSVMGNNPSRFSDCGDNCPVNNVSWNDAQDYIRKLSQKTGKTYRLPSEAEWEFVCRAGGVQTYCGGEKLDSVGWYSSNSVSMTHPVAGKQANAWGFYDMSGNVWEWTADCWNENYNGALSDGNAWLSGDCKRRVLRGGSWDFSSRFARSTTRVGDSLASRNTNVGFRLARMLP